MHSTIEISHGAIRIIQCNKEHVEEIDEFPVAEGVDPISALSAISLSSSLGPVRVVIHHEDFLLGSMTQAPCPADRLGRLVEFEMKSSLGEQVSDSLINWYVSPTGGTGDMRILTAITKRSLVERLQEALKLHKGRMISLVPAPLGLFENWKLQGKSGSAILLDIGGKSTHVAIAEESELLFLRSISIGMDELVNDISELRSIEKGAARELVGKLNKNTPDDIKEIIYRHAAQIAQQVNNVVRFAQAQLKVSKINVEHTVFSGAGARAPFFVHACSKHLNSKALIFNPFPLAAVNLPPSQMDKLSELPSPWGPSLGAAQVETIKLDGLHQVHRETKQFRETSGILRLAAAVTVALLIWSFVNQSVVSHKTDGGLGVLKGNNNGLVPSAEQKLAELNTVKQEHQKTLDKSRFIDGERRTGKISHEILTAITETQDLMQCPISVQALTVQRPGNGLVVVEIHGRAQSINRLDTATVISNFEEGLHQRLPFFTKPMTNIPADTANAPQGYHAFAYRIEFPDHM